MKKLAIILAALVMASSLAACGSSAPSGSVSASQPGSTSSSSVVAAPPQSGASSSGATSGSAAQETPDADLSAVMDSILEGIPEEEMPMLMPTQDGSKYMALTQDNSEYNVGVSRDAYVSGICAEAAISAQAHSVCLLKAEDAEKAQQLAKDVAEKANPNKWICVGAERVVVEYSGDTVLLVMSYDQLAQTIADNFKTHFGADSVTVVKDEDMTQGMDDSQGGELIGLQ